MGLWRKFSVEIKAEKSYCPKNSSNNKHNVKSSKKRKP